MTAREIAADLRELLPQDPEVVLTFLAHRIYDARLANGIRVIDGTDCKYLLLEIAQEMSYRQQPVEVHSANAQMAEPARAGQTNAGLSGAARFGLVAVEPIDSDESWQASHALMDKLRGRIPQVDPPLVTFARTEATWARLKWISLLVAVTMAVMTLVIWKWGGK